MFGQYHRQMPSRDYSDQYILKTATREVDPAKLDLVGTASHDADETNDRVETDGALTAGVKTLNRHKEKIGGANTSAAASVLLRESIVSFTGVGKEKEP